VCVYVCVCVRVRLCTHSYWPRTNVITHARTHTHTGGGVWGVASVWVATGVKTGNNRFHVHKGNWHLTFAIYMRETDTNALSLNRKTNTDLQNTQFQIKCPWRIHNPRLNAHEGSVGHPAGRGETGRTRGCAPEGGAALGVESHGIIVICPDQQGVLIYIKTRDDTHDGGIFILQKPKKPWQIGLVGSAWLTHRRICHRLLVKPIIWS